MVASLMSVLRAFWAQPVMSATRFLRLPTAANICGLSFGDLGGNFAGAKATIERSFLGNILANGLAMRAPNMASLNRLGWGKMKASIHLMALSSQRLSYFFSIYSRA